MEDFATRQREFYDPIQLGAAGQPVARKPLHICHDCRLGRIGATFPSNAVRFCLAANLFAALWQCSPPVGCIVGRLSCLSHRAGIRVGQHAPADLHSDCCFQFCGSGLSGGKSHMIAMVTNRKKIGGQVTYDGPLPCREGHAFVGRPTRSRTVSDRAIAEKLTGAWLPCQESSALQWLAQSNYRSKAEYVRLKLQNP